MLSVRLQYGCLTCRTSNEDSNEDHGQKPQRKVSRALLLNGRMNTLVNIDDSDQERLVEADVFFVEWCHCGR